MKKRKITVIGVGSIGRRHARLLSERDDLAVELCEPNEQSLGRALKEVGDLAYYKDVESALAAKPEMVVVATPHNLHADQAIAALESGAHVLCEKPISDNLLDAHRMKEAVERTGRVLTVGFHMHFHPGVRRMIEIIESGALGEMLHIHCRVGSYITLVNSASRHQAKVKGALLMDYTHQPDLFYLLIGHRPRGVYMAARKAGDLELSSDPNYISVICDYDTPLLATLHLNYVQMPERHEYEIVGDRAWLHWDMIKGTMRIGDRERREETVEQISPDRDSVYRAEHQAFIDAVDGKRAPESPAADALVSLEFMEAAMESWRNNSRVELPERVD